MPSQNIKRYRTGNAVTAIRPKTATVAKFQSFILKSAEQARDLLVNKFVPIVRYTILLIIFFVRRTLLCVFIN